MTRLLPAALLALAAAPLPAQDAPAPADRPARLETPTGTLHGSLLLPAAAGPVPVVVLIAGSGPTDRDGNTPLLPGRNDSLRLLAQGLAAEGIASVRYDKRGIAASRAAGTAEADLRLETYADDAAAWVRQLRADPRFSTITLAGHSEGSLIGMLAARRSPPDAFVSIAGPARRTSDLLREQLRPQLGPELARHSERILARLEAGETADSVPPELRMLYRPSVQPYLVSLLRYTPAEELARLALPVLIVQGTSDIQVAAAEARALKEARPAARLVVVEGMNHLLKQTGTDPTRQQAAYVDPSLPVSPEAVRAIADFVREAPRRR